MTFRNILRLPVCYFHWRFKCMGCQRHKKCVQVVPEGRLDIYMYYIYIHICTVIGFSSCCSTTQYVFENWLCMQSHICGSLRLFAHFLCERGKLGANSTLVPSWGREGPRKNRGKRKQARRPHQLAQGVSAYCSTMSLCVYHDLGAWDTCRDGR